MKSKLFKTLSSLLLAAVLTAGMAVTVCAKDASVIYEGGAEKFVFLPGSSESGTDLFDNFKGVMPGDVLQQAVTVKNNCDGCDKVNIYLRAETHKDDGSSLGGGTKDAIEDAVSMRDFLSKLSMKVKNGDKTIYEASADQLDGLKDNVLLGTFRYGEEAKLTVELSVPAELDNTYADRIGEVDWVFAVEEMNDSSPSRKHHHSGSSDTSVSAPQNAAGVISPQTGDSANLMLWGSLPAVCILAIAFMAVIRRKKQR